MAPRKLAAGNWKMNGDLAALDQLDAIVAAAEDASCDVLLCPPALLIHPMVARVAAGETLDNRLVRMEEATITGGSYEAPIARLTVRFRSDIAAVTRDAEGHVIAGSLDDAVEAIDIWTFSRNVTSPDPDWLIDETDEG